MLDLTDRQRKEAEKILRYLKKMEDIIVTSPSAEQKERLRRDLVIYKRDLARRIPNLDVHNKRAAEIASLLGIELDKTASSPTSPNNRKIGELLAAIPIKQASPRCYDSEINFLSTILLLVENVYWLALSPHHCHLDFSHASKRDSLRMKLDNALRSLKSLVDTIEETLSLDQADSHKKLMDIKGRYTRSLVMETNGFMTETRNFLRDLLHGDNYKRSSLQNPHERIRIGQLHKEAATIDGKTVREALSEFCALCEESIEYLALPRL